MALLDLKVRVIPDMKQFNRDIQRGMTGVGGPGKKPIGKAAEVQVSGFGKMLAGVAGMFAIMKSLDFLITPILRLLDIILKAFFVPLLPLVTKLLQFFTKKEGALGAALGAPQFTTKAEDNIVAAFVKGILNVGARVALFFGTLIVDEFIEPVGKMISDTILNIANFFSGLIRQVSTMISNAILRGWDLIVSGFNFIKDGLRNIINSIIDFVNSLIPGTRFDIGRTSNTEVYQSFPITVTGNTFRSEADMRSLADNISNQIRKDITLKIL